MCVLGYLYDIASFYSKQRSVKQSEISLIKITFIAIISFNRFLGPHLSGSTWRYTLCDKQLYFCTHSPQGETMRAFSSFSMQESMDFLSIYKITHIQGSLYNTKIYTIYESFCYCSNHLWVGFYFLYVQSLYIYTIGLSVTSFFCICMPYIVLIPHTNSSELK